MKLVLEITKDAIENLTYFNQAVQVTIFDALEQQLINHCNKPKVASRFN